MTVEQVKDELYRLKSDIVCDYPLRTTQQKKNFIDSIDVAIKSLETLEVVKEEVDKLTVYHTTKQGSELLSKNAVIRLINKHLKEIEE